MPHRFASAADEARSNDKEPDMTTADAEAIAAEHRNRAARAVTRTTEALMRAAGYVTDSESSLAADELRHALSALSEAYGQAMAWRASVEAGGLIPDGPGFTEDDAKAKD